MTDMREHITQSLRSCQDELDRLIHSDEPMTTLRTRDIATVRGYANTYRSLLVKLDADSVATSLREDDDQKAARLGREAAELEGPTPRQDWMCPEPHAVWLAVKGVPSQFDDRFDPERTHLSRVFNEAYSWRHHQLLAERTPTTEGETP